MQSTLTLQRFDGTSRVSASLPKEMATSICLHANDLHHTPSAFIALCVNSMIDLMDSDKDKLPEMVEHYRILKHNSSLKSQHGPDFKIHMNRFGRISASLAKEIAPTVHHHAYDLYQTTSSFICLCVDAILEMMDASQPIIPHLVQLYRFLRKSRMLKSQYLSDPKALSEMQAGLENTQEFSKENSCM